MTSKELLIDASLRLLERDGLEGFTIRQVAEFCNLSVAAPYKHFKNKDELLYAATQKMVEQWKVQEAQSIAQYAPDLKEQMVQLSMEWIRFSMETRPYAYLLTVDQTLLPEHVKELLVSSTDYARDCLSRLSLREQWEHSTFLRREYMMRSLTEGAIRQFYTGAMEYRQEQLDMVEDCLRWCLFEEEMILQETEDL